MRVIFMILFLGCTISKGQIPTLNVSGTTVSYFGSAKYNGGSIAGQKSGETLDYSEVEGRCFWDNEWNPAIMIINGGREMKMPKIKLNFYTNDIHYVDSEGNELVTPAGFVKKLVFFSANDTLNAIAFFENIKGVGSNKKGDYFQIFNDGDVQLLKRVVVTLRKQEYDPLTGKGGYSFLSAINYYIRKGETMNTLKAFNKSSILSIVESTAERENWLSFNKNKLKNQNDVLEFLAFVNSEKK